LQCCGVGRKPESGGIKAAKAAPSVRTKKPPAGRKGTFDNKGYAQFPALITR